MIPLPLYHSSLSCVQLYAFHVRVRLRLLLQQHLPKGPELSKAALEWRRRRTLRMSHYYHCLDSNCFLVPRSEAPPVSHLFVLLLSLSHDDASLIASLLLSESRRQPLASTESTTVSKRSFWICAGTSQTSREKIATIVLTAKRAPILFQFKTELAGGRTMLVPL